MSIEWFVNEDLEKESKKRKELKTRSGKVKEEKITSKKGLISYLKKSDTKQIQKDLQKLNSEIQSKGFEGFVKEKAATKFNQMKANFKKNMLKRKENVVKALKGYGNKLVNAAKDELVDLIDSILKVPEPILLVTLKTVAAATEALDYTNKAINDIPGAISKATGNPFLGQSLGNMLGNLAAASAGLPTNLGTNSYKADPTYSSSYAIKALIAADYAIILLWLIGEYRLDIVNGSLKSVFATAPMRGATHTTLLVLKEYKRMMPEKKYKLKAYEFIKTLILNGRKNFNFGTLMYFISTEKIKPSAFGTRGCSEYKTKFMIRDTEWGLCLPVKTGTLQNLTYPTTPDHVILLNWMAGADFSFMNANAESRGVNITGANSNGGKIPDKKGKTIKKFLKIDTDKYIVAGLSGKVAYSEDNKNWSYPRDVMNGKNIYDMIHVNDMTIVVGENGYIAISDSFRSFNTPIKVANEDIKQIYYEASESRYILICKTKIYYSIDLINWNSRDLVIYLATPEEIASFNKINNYYFFVRMDGQIFCTTNLVSGDMVFYLSEDTVRRIIHIDNKFVLLGTGLIRYADDNDINNLYNNFTNISVLPGKAIKNLVYLDDKYIAIANDGMLAYTYGIDNHLTTSGWSSSKNVFNSRDINNIFYENGIFTLSGEEGYLNYYENFLNWEKEKQVLFAETQDTTTSSGITKDLKDIYDIIYEDNNYIIVGGFGLYSISKDLKEWSLPERLLGVYDIHNILYNDNNYIVSGKNGFINYGESFNNFNISKDISQGNNINTLLYNNPNYIIGDRLGYINYTSDLSTWPAELTSALHKITRDAGVIVDRKFKAIHKIIFANGNYIAVGAGGYINYTSDLSTWPDTSNIILNGKNINDIIYFDNNYIVVGDGGLISYSTDLITWSTPKDIFMSKSIKGIFNIGTRLVIYGQKGFVSYADEFENWKLPINILGSEDIITLKYINNTYVAVGKGGMLNYTSDISKWNNPTPILDANLVEPASFEAKEALIQQKEKNLSKPNTGYAANTVNTNITDVIGKYDSQNRLESINMLVRLWKNQLVFSKVQTVANQMGEDVLKASGLNKIISEIKDTRSVIYRIVKKLKDEGLM